MKSDEVLVTVITATYNLIKSGRKDFFIQNLESVRNQSHDNIEHIIIDGASNDGTFELIEKYAKKGWIKYISEPDSGIYNAMNKGIEMSKGKYVAFLNSDDYYCDENVVRDSVSILERNNADYSYADYFQINNDEKIIVNGEIDKFLYTMPFGHPTMFTKAEVLRKEKGFNESFKLPADYDLVLRLILKDYKGVYLNKPVACYRVGGLGSTLDHSDEIAKIYVDNYRIFHKSLDEMQSKKIMYELKAPEGFIANFKNYAINNECKNINIDKVVKNFMDHVYEYREKNDLDLNHNMGEGIPVFLSSDNNYAPFIATTIASIMANTKSRVDFYILDGGISINNAQRINSLKNEYENLNIEFLEIDTERKFGNLPTRLHFSIDMYTRFLIPLLKPNLDKIIYSDVDVIFTSDIKNLLDENLEGHIIGAVPYTYGYLNPDKSEIESYHSRLGLSSDHEYFESGLLLMDVQLCLKNNITDKLIDVAKNSSVEKILTPDQDVLNIVFDNNYKKLDNKYIVVPHRRRVMLLDPKARKSVENPAIIHYAGANKPWANPRMELADYFWQYARITSFYEELIYNLSENIIKNYNSENLFQESLINVKKTHNSFFDKVKFAIFSPQLFFKKYLNLMLNGPLRQPMRKIWYFVRGKKL